MYKSVNEDDSNKRKKVEKEGFARKTRPALVRSTAIRENSLNSSGSTEEQMEEVIDPNQQASSSYVGQGEVNIDSKLQDILKRTYVAKGLQDEVNEAGVTVDRTQQIIQKLRQVGITEANFNLYNQIKGQIKNPAIIDSEVKFSLEQIKDILPEELQSDLDANRANRDEINKLTNPLYTIAFIEFNHYYNESKRMDVEGKAESVQNTQEKAADDIDNLCREMAGKANISSKVVGYEDAGSSKVPSNNRNSWADSVSKDPFNIGSSSQRGLRNW